LIYPDLLGFIWALYDLSIPLYRPLSPYPSDPCAIVPTLRQACHRTPPHSPAFHHLPHCRSAHSEFGWMSLAMLSDPPGDLSAHSFVFLLYPLYILHFHLLFPISLRPMTSSAAISLFFHSIVIRLVIGTLSIAPRCTSSIVES
jgi:hypothetical protein